MFLEIRILTGVHRPVHLLFGLFIDQRGEKPHFLNEFSVLSSDLVTVTQTCRLGACQLDAPASSHP